MELNTVLKCGNTFRLLALQFLASWFIVESSEGAVVINMFAHASFITPQCVCFIQTKPNALGQPVLLWGRTPLWLLSLLQVGHSPWSPPR